VLEAPPERPRVTFRTNGRIPPGPPPTGGGDEPDGEPSPGRPALDNALLATMFFIGAEVMFFGGLVTGFWVLRVGAAVWPPPLQPRLPVAVTGLNTGILLASSAAVVAAFRALRRGDRGVAVARLAVGAALGALFLAVQGYEWGRLIHFGLTVSSGAYGGTFYTLIGAHAVHVLGALVWLLVMLRLLARGGGPDTRHSTLRACALYWHFVVALWPVLYVSVYLL
jgi:heme/copper-type cytochrome/quinol oxidase subunit 3